MALFAFGSPPPPKLASRSSRNWNTVQNRLTSSETPLANPSLGTAARGLGSVGHKLVHVATIAAGLGTRQLGWLVAAGARWLPGHPTPRAPVTAHERAGEEIFEEESKQGVEVGWGGGSTPGATQVARPAGPGRPRAQARPVRPSARTAPSSAPRHPPSPPFHRPTNSLPRPTI